MISSKIVNFNRTEAGLTSKWGRISPAAQWRYQNQSNCIVKRCMTSGDVTKKFGTHTETLRLTHMEPWDKTTHIAM